MPPAPETIPWQTLAELIARDPARRGLTDLRRTDPTGGELTGADALNRAVASLAGARKVAIVTGFCIADALQPVAETDGPPGAVYLAWGLAELGIEPLLVSDAFSIPLVEACCDARGLNRRNIVTFPFEPLGSRERNAPHLSATTDRWIVEFARGAGRGLTHLVSIERCGPSQTLESLQAQGASDDEIAEFQRDVPTDHRDVCHNMRGIDITAFTAKTHRLFEYYAHDKLVTTIGVGDGGNELGMGAIPWGALHAAIPFGPAGQIACRIATQHLLVCGVSNWGGYALALGVAARRGQTSRLAAGDVESERAVIERLVRETTAVDGVTRERTATVDGLPLETYLQILGGLRSAVGLAE